MPQSANPLKQFFRQPAIYLRLPSNGNFWPAGSLEMTPNSELPVYPMTAIDEITYRTPDALFNGQAVINVIQSCVPSIKDAWKMPFMDLNAVLVAIRIASYGHDMELFSTCPECTNESEYTIDLRTVLDQLRAPNFNEIVKHGDLEITFQPMSYETQNQNNQLQFEQQKSIQVIQQSDISDTEKIKQLNLALNRITELTIEAMKWSIATIRTPHALVTEVEFIQEFLTNCERKLFTQIRDHIIKLREEGEVRPMHIECSECHHKYEQTLTMDQTSFFEGAS
jgi:hypothetical protein